MKLSPDVRRVWRRFFFQAMGLIIFAPQAWAQTIRYEPQSASGVPVPGMPRSTTQAACDSALRVRNLGGEYHCHRLTLIAGEPTPVVCDPAPAPTTATIACPSGTTGSWVQTSTGVRGQAPACVLTTTLTPAAAPVGACTPIVTPPPVVTGALHFSPGGVDSAAGTQAAPKRNLTSSMINSAAAGSTFLLECGASHTFGGKLALRNTNARAANRIIIGGYGNCAAGPAVLNFPANTVTAVEFGLNFGDGTPHEGYTLQNLRFVRAPSTNEGWGIYFKNDIRAVTLQGNSFEGWTTNINAQGGHRTREILVRGNDLRGFSGGHGVLGRFTDSQFIDNINEPGATGFTHAFYLSEGSGNVLRGNRIVKNGRCTGGGITMHSGYTTGQGESAPKPIAGVIVEGNSFEYSEPPASSCYGVSLSPYESAPAPGGFSGVVVSGNRITNASTGINVVAAPGALIEGNVLIGVPSAVSYRNYAEDPADLAGPGTVRNNTLCGGGGISAPSGSTVTDNVTRTGTDATTGVCAR